MTKKCLGDAPPAGGCLGRAIPLSTTTRGSHG